MSLKVWWPLFPLLFLIVLSCLLASMVQLWRRGGASRIEWALMVSALLTYSLTYALARWPWLHMPMSNLSELIMLFNVYHFFRKKRKVIAWLNVSALLAVACDFALHYILR